jgi:hypothetical protein
VTCPNASAHSKPCTGISRIGGVPVFSPQLSTVPVSGPPTPPQALGKSIERHPDEPADHALGRSRGGLGSKFHVVTDGAGTPLAIEVTAGQVHESTRAESVRA